ncbi:unnamed protein product [Candidula unifasciata]|uniref:G-protein coupled receptors family 1 profile domain-containing protein n=1 Tax=Candidula unifasciata TaxID=100452 RepID=A0A8S3YR41_9EUPU|nr:unnamed protein product [Candidula unifasciata]
MEFITPLNVLLSTAGVVLNLANITVFLRQDWRTNNVTLTLLSLSITDFLIVLTCLIFDLLSIFQTALPTSTVDFAAVQYYIYYIVVWSIAMFSDISSLTTVLVSLERCLCIIMPLHVQSLFSVKRTLTVLPCLWMFILFTYSVPFSTVALNWTYNPSFNNSRLTVSLSKERMTVETIHNISNTILLQTFYEMAVAINTVVMVIGLKRSSNFQRKSTNISSGHHSNLASSPKYKRLVTVVCCISSIFIACNTPTVVFIYCKHFVPGFSYAGDYKVYYVAGMYVIFLLYSVNASVNFFVYFSLNRRFRDTLVEIVRGPVCRLGSTKEG